MRPLWTSRVPGGSRAHGGDAAPAVVLLHGYLCLMPRAYWLGLVQMRRTLAARGIPVVLARAPRTGGVAVRAGVVARQLAELRYSRLVLVGHSMGGLDARYLASRLDRERRIARVVTLGTPHGGTVAAEWALSGRGWPAALLRLLDRGALRDLTRDGAHALDRLMPDRGDVAYRAMAGHFPAAALEGPLAEIAAQVDLEEGGNDGVVALRSATRWHAPVTVAAHHLGLIGHRMSPGPDRAEPAADPPPELLMRLLLAELALPTPVRAGGAATVDA